MASMSGRALPGRRRRPPRCRGSGRCRAGTRWPSRGSAFAVALGVLAVALDERAVVVAHRRGQDELGLAHDGVAVPVAGQVDEPQPEAAQLALQPVQRRAAGRGEVARDERAHLVADHADELGVEGLLRREVGVERAHGEPGAAGDLVDVGLEVALLAEEAPARGEQALARPLLERDGERLGRAAEHGAGVEGHPGEEPARRIAVQVLDADLDALQGTADGAEADAAEGEEVLGMPAPRGRARAQAALVDGDELALVLEEPVLPFAEHRDEVGVVPREVDDGLDERRSRSRARPPARFDRLPDHVQHPDEDAAEEGFLVLEVSVEDTVGEARGPADLRDGDDPVPFLARTGRPRLRSGALRYPMRRGHLRHAEVIFVRAESLDGGIIDSASACGIKDCSEEIVRASDF